MQFECFILLGALCRATFCAFLRAIFCAFLCAFPRAISCAFFRAFFVSCLFHKCTHVFVVVGGFVALFVVQLFVPFLVDTVTGKGLDPNWFEFFFFDSGLYWLTIVIRVNYLVYVGWNY